MIDEIALQGVEIAIRQAFDGRDRPALRFERWIDAGINRRSIDQYGADAAFGFLTTDFGPGESQIQPEELRQRTRFGDVTIIIFAVYGQI
jgi:hypothetical protein